MKDFIKWFDSPAKIIGGIIVLIVLGIVLKRLFNSLAEKVDLVTTTTQGKTEVESLIAGGMLPTYSDTEYESFADMLFIAFDGNGTDDSAVEDVFSKMENKVDVLKLILAYGTKVLESWGMDEDPKNLPMTMVSEGVDIEEINSLFMLKGVDYTF